MTAPEPDIRPTLPAGLVPDASVVAVEAYGELRTRVSSLVADLAPEQANAVVPACPSWTVTQTLAHLVGVSIDIVDGNMEGVTTEAWTGSQVERFAGLGIAGLLERWAATAPVIDSLGGVVPGQVASQLVFDAVTHEHDLRAAVARPGGRDSSAVVVGFGFVQQMLQARAAAGSVPPLVLHVEDADLLVGDALVGSSNSVRASRWELLRSFSGRRSAAQVAALDWRGDPTPYLLAPAGSPFSAPAVPLIE